MKAPIAEAVNVATMAPEYPCFIRVEGGTWYHAIQRDDSFGVVTHWFPQPKVNSNYVEWKLHPALPDIPEEAKLQLWNFACTLLKVTNP